MSRSNDIAGLTTSILDGVTATEVGLGNVTNESKATMFTSPTFTGDVALGSNASGTFTGTFNGTISSSMMESHQYTTLSNNWNPWNLSTGSGSTGYEEGVRVQRMGPVYIINMMVTNQNLGTTGTYYSTIVTLDSNITNPTNTVRCGSQFFSTSTQADYSVYLEIQTDGDIVIFMYNPTGTGFHIVGNFMGLDTA